MMLLKEADTYLVCAILESCEATDIMVKVIRYDEGRCERVIGTFGIGALMRETVEDWWGTDSLVLPDVDFRTLVRWADQLELYAKIMRSALACRIVKDSGE